MATKTHRGDAPDIQDAWSLTPANVNIGNTFTVTCNGKSITVTATAATVANVTALLADAINDNDDNILEFSELTAVDNTTHVTVTVNDKGRPTVLTASASGGTATLTELSTTAASGRYFWDTAVNWDGDVAPVDTDDAVVGGEGSDILYGLDQSTISLASLILRPGSKNIGLPEVHQAGGQVYDEFRDTYLTLDDITALEVYGDAPRVKINPGSNALCAAVIDHQGIREDPDVPAILLLGAHASNQLTVLRGDVGVAYYQGETANWPTIYVGYVEDQLGDVSLFLGDGMSTITTLTQNGGRVSCEAVLTTLNLQNGEFTKLAGALTTGNIDGGTMIWRSSSNITSLLVGPGGVADFSRDLRPVTVTNCEIHAGGTILDPRKRVTFTNGVDLVRCGVGDVNLDLGEHRTLTPSAI